MITTNRFSRRTALLALACAVSLAFIAAPALQAADAPKAAADKAPALPVTTSIEKVTGGENGPFVLKVKNVSKDSLKVTAKVLLAVAFHADNKARNVPEHAIAAGQEYSIADLAAADKVVLTAAGFAPLEVAVPQK